MQAIVVGAGPAGIATVGALAARRLRVLWIDPAFRAGALDRYSAVPANTKLDVLVPGLLDYIPQGVPRGAPLDALKAMICSAIKQPHNPDPAAIGWTTLGSCQTLFHALTGVLASDPHIVRCGGRVVALESRTAHGHWAARIRGVAGGPVIDARDAIAPSVVLALGGRPVSAPPSLWPSAWAGGGRGGRGGAATRVLGAEDALSPERLGALGVGRHHVIGVVGGGHSGIVVVRHLLEVVGVRCVRLFVRRPLQLAAWDDAYNAYAAWAFRGLKGESASWALEHGLVGMPPLNGRVADRLEVHDTTALATDAHAASMDAVVYCLGYQAALPPALHHGGRAQRISAHEAPGGALLAEDGNRLPGLHGVGLGFSDLEYTSGQAYPQVGFVPFSLRAAEIADEVATRTQALGSASQSQAREGHKERSPPAWRVRHGTSAIPFLS